MYAPTTYPAITAREIQTNLHQPRDDLSFEGECKQWVTGLLRQYGFSIRQRVDERQVLQKLSNTILLYVNQDGIKVFVQKTSHNPHYYVVTFTFGKCKYYYQLKIGFQNTQAPIDTRKYHCVIRPIIDEITSISEALRNKHDKLANEILVQCKSQGYYGTSYLTIGSAAKNTQIQNGKLDFDTLVILEYDESRQSTIDGNGLIRVMESNGNIISAKALLKWLLICVCSTPTIQQKRATATIDFPSILVRFPQFSIDFTPAMRNVHSAAGDDSSYYIPANISSQMFKYTYPIVERYEFARDPGIVPYIVLLKYIWNKYLGDVSMPSVVFENLIIEWRSTNFDNRNFVVSFICLLQQFVSRLGTGDIWDRYDNRHGFLQHHLSKEHRLIVEDALAGIAVLLYREIGNESDVRSILQNTHPQYEWNPCVYCWYKHGQELSSHHYL